MPALTRALRHVPAVRLLAAAELIALARQHISKLEPHERQRVVELLRATRGRPGRLTQRQRRELASLVRKAEPRAFVEGAVQKLTGVSVPKGRGGRSRRKT